MGLATEKATRQYWNRSRALLSAAREGKPVPGLLVQALAMTSTWAGAPRLAAAARRTLELANDTVPA